MQVIFAPRHRRDLVGALVFETESTLAFSVQASQNSHKMNFTPKGIKLTD